MTPPFVSDRDFTLYLGDARKVLHELPEVALVDCCVTSPPYWGLRDYGTDGQIGLEQTPDEYVELLLDVFRGVRRLLKPEGTLWLNLGDSYHGGGYANHAVNGETWLEEHGGDRRRSRQQDRINANPGLKPKDLVGIPWRVAFALQQDGWYLRADIIWSKPNPMPESVTDRPTKAHEYVFLLTKSARYFFDPDAVREPAEWHRWGAQNGAGKYAGEHSGAAMVQSRTKAELQKKADGVGRNVRSVWEIATQPYPDAHFATFPEALPERCIKAGCPEGGVVLDPFLGSGTTALVARRLGRKCVGIELNEEYARLAARRLQQLSLLAENTA